MTDFDKLRVRIQRIVKDMDKAIKKLEPIDRLSVIVPYNEMLLAMKELSSGVTSIGVQAFVAGMQKGNELPRGAVNAVTADAAWKEVMGEVTWNEV